MKVCESAEIFDDRKVDYLKQEADPSPRQGDSWLGTEKAEDREERQKRKGGQEEREIGLMKRVGPK